MRRRSLRSRVVDGLRAAGRSGCRRLEASGRSALRGPRATALSRQPTRAVRRRRVAPVLRRQRRRRQDDGVRGSGAAAGARRCAAARAAAVDRSGALARRRVRPPTSATRARAIPGGPPNLVVRELDAGARARRPARAARGGARRDRVGRRRSSAAAPATAPSELMNLAPPGIDELFGVLSVVDARAAYDVIVVDTAPTGHALRLLEMPDAAREWMQVLLRVLLKYRSLVRPGQLAAELVEVSKSIRELHALLRDATHDAVHRRDARRRGAAARDRTAAGAASPPPSCRAGDRRQRADAGAGTLCALPRGRGGRAARARARCGGCAAAGALSSRRRWRRRRRAASRRWSGWARTWTATSDMLKSWHLRLLRRRRGRAAAPRRGCRPDCPARARSACSTSIAGLFLAVADAPLDRYGEAAINRGLGESRLGVARRRRARGGGRVVHRRDRRAADEAVHASSPPTNARSQHVRGAARAHRPRSSSASPTITSGACASCSTGTRAAAAAAEEENAGDAGSGACVSRRRRRRSAMRSRELAMHAPATRWRRLFDRLAARSRDARRRSGERAAGARRTAAARRGVSRAARSRGAFQTLAAARGEDARAQGYGLTLTGPWPPYTFVQD